MGTGDRALADKIDAKSPKTSKKGARKWAEYVDLKPTAKDKKVIGNQVKTGDETLEFMEWVVSTLVFSFKVEYDTRNSCLKLEMWKSGVSYTDRTIYVVRHNDVVRCFEIAEYMLKQIFTEEGFYQDGDTDDFDF